MSFYADDGNNAILYEDCTRNEAAQQYVDDGDWGVDDETVAVTVLTWPEYDEDDVVHHLMLIHPDEPACLRGREKHEWVETSLQGHGAGVRMREECRYCEAVQRFSSCSQGVAATEHDHDSYAYEAGRYDCEACHEPATRLNDDGYRVCDDCETIEEEEVAS